MARGRRPRPAADPFDAIDHRLFDLIEAQNLSLRAVLCTLARHGVVFRQREPERARRWIDELSRHPLFKGGQFLFDLLEWDDFILDGEPPPLLDASILSEALTQIASTLDLQIELAPRQQAAASDDPAEEPPVIQPGFNLYRDVVLGLLSVARSVATSIPPDQGALER
jgi:hypothetical protein